MNTQTQYAWHFSNGYLSNGDNRQIVTGMSLACKPEEIRLCNDGDGYGFHASKRIIDALGYAPGNVLSYCEMGGRIIEGDDQLVASQCRHVIIADIERTLHEFALWCAEEALGVVDNPDPRSVNAVEVKRLWLDGKATDSELAVAQAAAWGAARDAWGEAWVTARVVAHAATSLAVWAARNAACPVQFTRVATQFTRNEKLTEMVMALPEFATCKIK